MRMTRLTVTLLNDEKRALQILSQEERRHIREQAAVLIRCELERRGLLLETAVTSKQTDSEQTLGGQ